MTTQTAPAPVVRNGVPVTKLFGSRDKIATDPSLGQFRFTATNSWIDGTASQSSIREWYGVGQHHDRDETYSYTYDHPTLGNGHGPTPQETVLGALAGCLTAGIITTAAARKIELTSVTSKVTGDLDVRGVLAIDAGVRPGFGSVAIEFAIEGDADADSLAALAEASRKTSAVYDMLVGSTPVEVSVA